MKKLMTTLSITTFMFTFSALNAAEPMFYWTSVDGATGYIIYGANTAAGVTKDSPMVLCNVGSVTSYPVMSLNTPIGEEWYFAVSAYNDAEESDLSNVVSWTRLAFVPPPNITLPPIQAPKPVVIKIQTQ